MYMLSLMQSTHVHAGCTVQSVAYAQNLQQSEGGRVLFSEPLHMFPAAM